MSSEKSSIITLRLTAEEAAQLEILKDLVGKKSGSEALKHIMREYPRFCAHYKQEAKQGKDLQRKYQEEHEALSRFVGAFEALKKLMGD